MRLVKDLQHQGVTLEAHGDRLRCRGSAEVLTPELRSELTAHKAAILAYLQSQDAAKRLAHSQEVRNGLHQEIQQARDWQDLNAILARAQGAYERGELIQEQVEELAIQAAETGRGLPEKAVDAGGVVWAEDLLPPAADACPCCGRSAWWGKAGGEWICGVCHPVPRTAQPTGRHTKCDTKSRHLP